MDNSAEGSLTSQKVVHLKDEEEQQATGELHSGVSNEFNKTGLPPITPQSVDPNHESILEGVKHLGEEWANDVMRVGKQTLREITVGSYHTNVTNPKTKPYSIETKKATDKAEEDQKKAA